MRAPRQQSNRLCIPLCLDSDYHCFGFNLLVLSTTCRAARATDRCGQAKGRIWKRQSKPFCFVTRLGPAPRCRSICLHCLVGSLVKQQPPGYFRQWYFLVPNFVASFCCWSCTSGAHCHSAPPVAKATVSLCVFRYSSWLSFHYYSCLWWLMRHVTASYKPSNDHTRGTGSGSHTVCVLCAHLMHDYLYWALK